MILKKPNPIPTQGFSFCIKTQQKKPTMELSFSDTFFLEGFSSKNWPGFRLLSFPGCSSEYSDP